MELLSIASEQENVQDGLEKIDTWNEPRSDKALSEFVLRKMMNHADFDDNDDLFGLAA
jgi:hypothetical protein